MPFTTGTVNEIFINYSVSFIVQKPEKTITKKKYDVQNVEIHGLRILIKH